jgi:taurine dioxygenase
MLSIHPSGNILGATVHGVDLAEPLSPADFTEIRNALGRYGVLCFPNQELAPARQKAFIEQFGNPQISSAWTIPDLPQISVLSNIIVDGRNIGFTDAGMSWHKDMTYLKKPGFATALYAIKVPRRNGRSLGSTHFINVQAAYDDLPNDIKQRLEGAIGVNSPESYNTAVRGAGGTRPAMATREKKRAPTLHPILMTHPITGRKVLYCDPGHVIEIEGFPQVESDELLRFLGDHQLQPKYEYVFEWTERDLLMWDNLGTLHRATLDYGPDEHRLMHRCLVSQPDDTSIGYI